VSMVLGQDSVLEVMTQTLTEVLLPFSMLYVRLVVTGGLGTLVGC
jgi:hypothetical protein